MFRRGCFGRQVLAVFGRASLAGDDARAVQVASDIKADGGLQALCKRVIADDASESPKMISSLQ
jgi:hypothetical protein